MRPENTPAREGQPGAQHPSTTVTKPQNKRGGRQKAANGLIALSSAAVIAVYAAGYVHTAPAVAGVASPVAIAATATATTVASLVTPATTVVATATTAVAPSAAAPPISLPATATTTAAATQPAQAATASSAYRDGTYTGSGTSRHGGVTVAVTIESGTIAAVTITASNTRYPISRIAALPGEVVAAQSAHIDFVSGATDSSMAFQTAVASALARAQE